MRFVIHADDGQPVQLQRTGRGRPLVLLHEWTADHSVWRRLTPALADSFTVHAWDARGHGATGAAPAPQAEPATQAEPAPEAQPAAQAEPAEPEPAAQP